MNKIYGYDTNIYETSIGNIKNIDLVKKSYEELQQEVIKLVTDKFLLQQEKDRLNNIINELEKWLNEKVEFMKLHSIERMVAYDDSLHKLKELKESNNV